jgi:ABC-2 type transport system permease protein
VPAAVLLVLFCATAARTLSTVLAARLTSRRGRDLTVIVASLIGLSAQGVRFVRFESVTVDMVDRAVDALRWLPPGMLGQAVIDGRAGRLPLALAELVPAAVLIAVLWWAWARALDRSMTVVADGATAPVRRRGRSANPERPDLPLIPARLPWLADRPWGAVTARELRYAAREPRRKVLLLNSVVIGAGLALWAALSRGHDSRAVLLATAASYIAVVNTINQVGVDGGARWMDVVAGDTARATLFGKNVAVALQIVPVVTLIAAVTAAITGGWALLPAAVVLSLAGLGAGLGVGNVVSVFFPVAPPSSQNPFASRGAGTGCGTMLAISLCVLAQNALLGPIAAAALIAAFVAPGWLAVVVPVAAIYGGGIWWAGLAVATPRLADRQAEILAIVDPVRGA